MGDAVPSLDLDLVRERAVSLAMDTRTLRIAAEQMLLALGNAHAHTLAELLPRARLALIDSPNLSPHTVIVRRAALRRLTPRFDTRGLDGSWLAEATALYSELPRPTASLTVSFLRTMLRLADRHGLRSGDHELSQLAQIYSAPKTYWLSVEELAAFDDGLDSIAADGRRFESGIDCTRAVILVPYRVSAICRLAWADVGGANATVSAIDKGKARTWPVGPVMRELLTKRRQQAGSPYVFPGKTDGEPVSRLTVWRNVKEAAKRAGLDPRLVTAHTLRHSLANNLLARDEGLDTVQVALGHSDQRVTRKFYCHSTPSRVRDAVAEFGLAVIAAKAVRS